MSDSSRETPYLAEVVGPSPGTRPVRAAAASANTEIRRLAVQSAEYKRNGYEVIDLTGDDEVPERLRPLVVQPAPPPPPPEKKISDVMAELRANPRWMKMMRKAKRKAERQDARENPRRSRRLAEKKK